MSSNYHSSGLGYPSVGEGYAPAYQVSAIPFVTSSNLPSVDGVHIKEIEFSNITRFFTIKNTGEYTLYFGFTENGVKGGNNFLLKKDESYIGEIRTTQLWISGTQDTTFSLLAGLTSIQSRFASPMTGSGVG